jgi:hypothetical protein
VWAALAAFGDRLALILPALLVTFTLIVSAWW